MIGWALDTAIAVSVLILAVLVIRRPFAQAFGARAAYALWLAPALRAVTPPVPSAPLPLPTLSGAANYTLVAGGSPDPSGPAVGTILAAIWFGGAALFLAVHLWRHQRFMREAVAAGRPLDIAGVPYDVVASSHVDGPMATGLVHPLILVPIDFQELLDLEAQRFALWHEQLHHRRGDIWASAGALLLVALLWFNPLAHLALGAFRRDMEAACDASLLAEAGEAAAPAYAATILRCASRPVPRSLCALTAIDELKGRLTMMKLNHGPARRFAGLALASAVALMGIATASAAQDKVKEEKRVMEIIRHAGDKDPVDHAGPGPYREWAANCPGEKFEAATEGGSDQRKEKVKFVLCAGKGESLLPALQKAEAEIQTKDDIPAAQKAEILEKIRAKIDELRAKG